MGDAPDPAEHGHGVLPAVPAAALLLPVHRHRDGAGRGANLSSGIIGCATYLRNLVTLLVCLSWYLICYNIITNYVSLEGEN